MTKNSGTPFGAYSTVCVPTFPIPDYECLIPISLKTTQPYSALCIFHQLLPLLLDSITVISWFLIRCAYQLLLEPLSLDMQPSSVYGFYHCFRSIPTATTSRSRPSFTYGIDSTLTSIERVPHQTELTVKISPAVLSIALFHDRIALPCSIPCIQDSRICALHSVQPTDSLSLLPAVHPQP